MPPDDSDFPDRPEPPLKPIGKHKLFTVVLILLALICFVLWLLDPAHRRDGRSHVDWPEPAGKKP